MHGPKPLSFVTARSHLSLVTAIQLPGLIFFLIVEAYRRDKFLSRGH